MYVKNHNMQVHIGKGSFSCNVCGFKALNPQKLEWHQKYHHKMKQPVKVKSNSSQPILKEVHRRSIRGNIPLHVDMLHCSACQFKSFSKKSLRGSNTKDSMIIHSSISKIVLFSSFIFHFSIKVLWDLLTLPQYIKKVFKPINCN